MLTHEQAQTFAQNWLDSWNSHNLNKIIAHYENNIEYYSIFSEKLLGTSGGIIHGKEQLKDYFKIGLQAYPHLHFQLIQVFTGINSITLLYQSVNNLKAAEVFEFNQEGLIRRVLCHYAA